MNPIVFAMRHPITVLVALAAILFGSCLAYSRMKVDIFPDLDLPVIYVVQPYGGMDPAQMEGLITFHYENHFLYISGIQHIESKCIQGFSQMKLYFHPGTNMVQAMAETVAQVTRARAFMPAGTVPPFVVRFDTGTLPVGYIVLSSKTKTIDEMQEQAYLRVRPMLVSLPGVSAPPPFGGNQRTIVVHVDPDRMRAHRLSPNDIVKALSSGNAIAPSGNVRIHDQMPIVPFNSMVSNPNELGKIPIRPEDKLYLENILDPVKGIEDGTDIPTSFALVNERPAVYMMVSKRSDASTLAVVNEIKSNLPNIRNALPEDVDVSFKFDQSPHVTNAMEGVGTEGLLGAFLTGLTVLLFLRDWRSVIVVVLNIPFALMVALVALWTMGETINLMTLGGLALSVGILVDESTVVVENIHAHMEKTPSIALAVWKGTTETAVPGFLAMLCILAVFIPSVFMEGAARNLFVPLSLAVGFSMIASFVLSNTFVPVIAVWLMRHHHKAAAPLKPPGRFSFERFRAVYTRLLPRIHRVRWLILPAYLGSAALVILVVGGTRGKEIFPKVDSGSFQMRLRAASGTRIENTQEITQKALEIIKEEAGPGNVDVTVAFGGVSPSSYTVNTIYLWTAGPEETVMRIGLRPHSGVRVDELKERLRRAVPEKLEPWLRQRLAADGLNDDQIAARIQGLRVSFEPADIVNEVMSFGSRTPVEVVVSGPKLADSQAYAHRLHEQLRRIPSLRDLQFVQAFDYPTVEVKVDRERAGESGITAEEVGRSLVPSTSSSRFTVPNFWRDPTSGVSYQVQIEVPRDRMNSANSVGMITIKQTRNAAIMVRNVADVSEGVMPGEYDRYNMRRIVSLTANVEGEDLGRAAERIDDAIRAAGEPPRGVTVDVRGQIVPMRQMFQGLSRGLVLAILVIFLLLAAYFQSFRLAFIVTTTVPAVIAGVVLALFVTRTTINIQSYMGAIMAVGVAVANAILLVTFAERSRRTGMSAVAAAVEGAQGRLRPILMTSMAMIAGMIPMALALGEGGEQTAPLGCAVIGGLAASTIATLLLLPIVFAVVQGRAGILSVSLDPFDLESRHFVPAPGNPTLNEEAALAALDNVTHGATNGSISISPTETSLNKGANS